MVELVIIEDSGLDFQRLRIYRQRYNLVSSRNKIVPDSHIYLTQTYIITNNIWL